MSKTERQETVATLSALLKDTPHLYVTDFSGMSVLRMTEFRRRLRAAGVSYVVVKNTLAQRALAANGITGLDEHLAGPTGLVLTKDPLAAATVTLNLLLKASMRSASSSTVLWPIASRISSLLSVVVAMSRSPYG